MSILQGQQNKYAVKKSKNISLFAGTVIIILCQVWKEKEFWKRKQIISLLIIHVRFNQEKKNV